MGVWGGWEVGAEGSLGRMGALGGPTDRRGFQPALAPNPASLASDDASAARYTPQRTRASNEALK